MKTNKTRKSSVKKKAVKKPSAKKATRKKVVKKANVEIVDTNISNNAELIETEGKVYHIETPAPAPVVETTPTISNDDIQNREEPIHIEEQPANKFEYLNEVEYNKKDYTTLYIVIAIIITMTTWLWLL